MKTQFNITSMKWDLERYTSVEDFATALEGFDGVELMDYGDDISPIIPEEKVIGIHMRCPYHWLDFWERRYGTVYPGIWIRKTGIRKFWRNRPPGTGGCIFAGLEPCAASSGRVCGIPHF